MSMRVVYILFGLSCLWSAVLHGQFRFDNYKYLTANDGLPSRYAFDLSEDKYGFMWIATAAGVVRYDGTRVIKLVKAAEDSLSLPSQYALSVLAVGDSLWIGTKKGLSILNLNTGKLSNHPLVYHHFTPIEHAGDEDFKTAVRDIYEDRQGNIWLTPGTGGIVKWDKKEKAFQVFPLLPDDRIPKAYSQGAQTRLVAIIQDARQDSIMWGACLAGLVKLNQRTGDIQRIWYDQGDELAQFQVNRKICLYQDTESSLIYSGSWSGGLSVYDPKTGRYNWLLEMASRYIHPSVASDFGHLYKIFPGEHGNLYLTYEQGLFRYNIARGTLELIKKNIFKGQRKIYGIDLVDSEGRIWDANKQGVTILDPVEQQFQRFNLSEINTASEELIPRAIVEDFYPDYISIAGQYSDGIYHVNTSTGHIFKSIPTDFKGRENNFSAWGLTVLDKDILLVSASKIYTHHRESGQLRPFDVQLPIKYNSVKDLLKDDFGKLWISTRGDGIFTIDQGLNRIVSHAGEVPYPNVLNLFQDEVQNIWMVTNYGHAVFDRREEKFQTFDYNQSPSKTFLVTRNFCECPNGEVWLAGEEGGMGLLSRKAPENGVIRQVQLKDDRGNTIPVSRIACGQDNELWAIYHRGLVKINRKDWTCEIFNMEYGVKQWHGMFQFLKNGDLFICSRDAFYTVDPDQLYRNDRLPKPYVASITSNKGPKNRIEDHLKSKPVRLSANENVITVEFSAINHSLAHRTKYQYMMSGLDDDWIDAGDKRNLNYSYLPGGDYVFKLRACNNEGIWNEEIYELPVHVGTPWYKTVLFGVIVVCSVLALVFAYYRQRIHQIRKASQLKSAFEKQKANLEMSALRAQMNPHFIFNCLNSIESYIIRNDSKKAAHYLNDFGRLVRLILQNSRTSYVNLEDELEALELYLKLEQMRLRHKFSYEISVAGDLNPENFEIPPMLIQPFVENAIWHGFQELDGNGKVLIQIQKVDEKLQCVIEDNGIGRAASAQIKASKKVKRKSMGMNITTERMSIINQIYDTKNEVQIEDLYDDDSEPCGTRVTLTIPL